MRKLAFEKLERRYLLSSSECLPIPTAYDVDETGKIDAADVVQIINAINAEQPTARTNVNCDKGTTPLDVLQTINHINRFGSTSVLPIMEINYIPTFIEIEKQQVLLKVSYSVPEREVDSEIALMIDIVKNGVHYNDGLGVRNLEVSDEVTGDLFAGPENLSGSNIAYLGFNGRLRGDGSLDISGNISRDFIGGKIRVTVVRMIWIGDTYSWASINDGLLNSKTMIVGVG